MYAYPENLGKQILTLIIPPRGERNRNRNDNQLERNTCTLVPTPILSKINQPLSGRGLDELFRMVITSKMPENLPAC